MNGGARDMTMDVDGGTSTAREAKELKSSNIDIYHERVPKHILLAQLTRHPSNHSKYWLESRPGIVQMG